jgi:cell division protein FtsZ
MMQAERGMQELLESVDTLIVIPNEKLLAVAKDAGFFESFRIADDILRQGVQGISDIITIPGVINRDFADVKTTMAGMGYSVMGTAIRSGQDRARDAASAAMASPLLEAGAIDGARGILINITGSSNLKLNEVNDASTIIQNAAHEDANIIFGAVLDESMGDEVKITVIATGFRQEMPQRRERMMAEATLPTIRRDPPPPPRITPRPTTPRFASEEIDDAPPAEPEGSARVVLPASEEMHEYARIFEHDDVERGEESITEPQPAPVAPAGTPRMVLHPESAATAASHRELLPVPASVFDDDFFRSPIETGQPERSAEISSQPAANDLSFARGVQHESDVRIPRSEARVPTFSGYAAASEAASESDELDIPAFLRRNH